MNTTEAYHGWLIELIPEQTGYSFRCWLPKETIAVSDRKVYATSEQALVVAKMRADLEAVSWAMIRFLNEIYGHCSISFKEHGSLASSISEFVISASKQCQHPPHLS